MQKKKILFLITKGNFGGAQRYVYDLATSLPKTKYEAIVACGQGGLLKEKLGEVNIRVVEIEKLEREIRFFNEFKVCSNLIKLIREEKPELIHLNSSKIGGVGAVAGRIAATLEKNYKPKIIFTSHGWGFHESHRSSFAKLFYYISHFVTILLCDKTIAVSQKTKRSMAWLPFMNSRIQVIHNGLDKFEMLERSEARNILDPGRTQKIILYSISELHKNKGLDVALRGIALLSEEIKAKILYCIAGEGEEKENLSEIVRNEGLENIVNLLGFIPDAKKLLSGADIFLFPSRTENLPFAILEAGLAELPIISTNVGGIPEIIQDMENGVLVHKENPREITHAIQYIIDHPECALEFSKKIYTMVSKNFSKTKMLRETVALYQNLCE